MKHSPKQEEPGYFKIANQLQLKDQIHNILLADKLQPSLTEAPRTQPRLEYPVSDRAIELG